MFEYTIDGKKYSQKSLVLGQVQQLIKFLKGKKLPETLTTFQIIDLLGDDLCEGIAIVLKEENRLLKDKDVTVLAKEIQFSIEPETAFKVVEDFFVCNPVASMLERLAGSIRKVAEQMMIGLKRPSSSSPEETSPAETKSSGDTPQENADLTLDTE
jgi:hypothetical protein